MEFKNREKDGCSNYSGKSISEEMGKEIGEPSWVGERLPAAAPLAQLKIAIDALKNYRFDEERGSTMICRESICDCKRLLWIGKDHTRKTMQSFFIEFS